MNENASYYLKKGSFIFLCVFIVGYTFFQTRDIIFGPSITVTSPIDGETYTDPLLEIKGTASNVNFLALDDRPIYTDTHGAFDEQLLMAEGYNIIKLVARDKFGSQTEKVIRIVFKQPQKITLQKPAPLTATSTKQTATSTRDIINATTTNH